MIDLAATAPVGQETGAGFGQRGEIVVLNDPNGNPAANGAFAIIKQNGAAVSVKFSGVTTEIDVTTNGTNNNDFMSATALRGGRVAVVLSGEGPNPSDPKVVLKIVSSLGVTGTLVLEGNKGTDPKITELEDGRLSVTWRDPTGSPSNISSIIVDPRIEKVIVQGTGKNDIYVGTEHNYDELYGYAGNDALYGGDGHDLLNGGVGEDTLNGGNGGDWADYTLAAAGVIADLTANTAALGRTRNAGDAMGDVYLSVENLRGSAHRDVLIGNDAENELEGMAGTDDLFGSAGADKMDGGADYDQASYQRSTAAILLDLTDADGSDNRGDAQGDKFISIEAYIGSTFNDTMTGADTYDTFYGHNGDDLLQGKENTDELFGDAGNDTLEGGVGADKLDGGVGFNFASYANAGAGVRAFFDTPDQNRGDAAGDTYKNIQGLIGSKHRDLLGGGLSNDILIGGDEDDQLYGLQGSDTLEGGAGEDVLDGSDGMDYASYAGATSGVTASLNTSSGEVEFASPAVASIVGTGGAAGDYYVNIEGLIGSAYADALIGDGKANVLRGGSANDTLDGGAGNDRLEGELGNDSLTGGAGADTLDGGAGDDTYYVDASDTIVEGSGQGIDTVYVTTDFTLSPGAVIENIVLSTTATVRLLGNELDNVLTGNAGANNLDGQAGNDLIVGGAGADTMTGGTGNDTLYVDNDGDVVVEHAGQGIDTVMVNTAAYVLGAGAEVETLMAGVGALNITGSDFANAIIGNGFNNQLWGKAGNDQIRGDVGHDRLYGGSGDDKLYGGVGNDQLKGEAGKDVFVFDTRTNKRTNVDKVLDFKSRDDSFYLDNKVFTKLGSGTESRPKKFNSDMFVEGTRAQDREDRIVYDKKSGALYYDQDGTGSKAQVKIATISNKTKLYWHDFFVI